MKFSNWILLALVGTAMACEKVIDLPLEDAEKQLVIEAVGRNFEGESYILISNSGTVYDDGGFEKISDAAITVTDKDGVATVFTEDPSENGRYIAPSFLLQPNNAYDLAITTGSQVVTSSAITNSLPKLDSLSYLYQVGGFGSAANDTNYLVFYNFNDNGAEENYYRVRAWVNGEIDNNFYIGDDALGNGQPVSAPLFATGVGPRDTVYVELLSMDEEAYTYLFTLSSNLTSGPFAATPANPVTNIDGGIGYFGAYMVDTMTVIIP